ncbi:hypothetical protein HY994_02770 [Candidatus Micrarchaeota archaeon]|nr:hypothetical protein [Candidatus Micrarchaeota archaeon]
MNVVGKIITMWGVLVFAAWASPQFAAINYFGTGFTASALILWTVVMAITLVATYKYMPGAMSNNVVKLWTIIVVGGMILNYANFMQLVPKAIAPYIYFHAWLALTAIGFALTALWWTPKSKMIFTAGAALNALLLVVTFLNIPFVAMYGLLLAGIVGGLPAVLDGVLNYNTPKSAHAPAAKPAVSVKVTIK